jgi:hypothetical protein
MAPARLMLKQDLGIEKTPFEIAECHIESVEIPLDQIQYVFWLDRATKVNVSH